MRNCPTCGFLVDDSTDAAIDDVDVFGAAGTSAGVPGASGAEAAGSCASCRAERAAGHPGGVATHAGVPVPPDGRAQHGAAVPGGDLAVVGAAGDAPASSGSTMLLDRPAPVPIDHVEVRYRSRSRRRRVLRVVVVLVLLTGGAATLIAFDARRDGPLSEQLVRLGVMGESVVSVPDDWGPVELGADAAPVGFAAQLPVDRSDVELPVSTPAPPATRLRGVEAPLGALGSIAALESGLGGAAAPGDADMAAIADAVVAAVPGEELSRRSAPIGDGRAIDVVLVGTGPGAVARLGPAPPVRGDVDDVDAVGASAAAPPSAVTTRVRVLVVADRLVVLLTSGVDDRADRLDDAHRRLVDSFTVER